MMQKILQLNRKTPLAVSYYSKKLGPLIYDHGVCIQKEANSALFGSAEGFFTPDYEVVNRFYNVYPSSNTKHEVNRVPLSSMYLKNLNILLQEYKEIAVDKEGFSEGINELDNNITKYDDYFVWNRDRAWIEVMAKCMFGLSSDEAYDQNCDEAKSIRNICVEALCSTLSSLNLHTEPLFEILENKVAYSTGTDMSLCNSDVLRGFNPVLEICGNIQYAAENIEWDELGELVDEVRNSGDYKYMRTFHDTIVTASKSSNKQEIVSELNIQYEQAKAIAKKHGLDLIKGSVVGHFSSVKSLIKLYKACYGVIKCDYEELLDMPEEIIAMFGENSVMKLRMSKREKINNELLVNNNGMAYLLYLSERIPKNE